MEHIHPDSPELDYNYITDGIYIGTNQCCIIGLSDVLKKEGIEADISLEEDRLDQPFGVDVYIWIPVKNHEAPTLDQLAFGVSSLLKLVSQNKKVYVHCKNGHGRAPTLVAGYLISKKGFSPEEALKFLASKREDVHFHKPQEKILKLFREKYKN